jgi:hypothetical protein
LSDPSFLAVEGPGWLLGTVPWSSLIDGGREWPDRRVLPASVKRLAGLSELVFSASGQAKAERPGLGAQPGVSASRLSGRRLDAEETPVSLADCF